MHAFVSINYSGGKQGSLLNQLAIANESLGGGNVVVMAERDKEEMESDIAKMEFDFKGTSVICRSGSPLILADLKKVCFHFSDFPNFIISFDIIPLCWIMLLFFLPCICFFVIQSAAQ